jgi:hypothetical protein
MTGCLTAPFKVLGCLGLLVVLGLGWLYRDRLVREGQRLLPGGASAPPASEVGRPGRRALESARAKVDSLNGWRADSVVLTASEVASLMGAGMDKKLRGQLDSMQVRLLDGEVEVGARLRTERLPREVVGPVGVALREREPVEAVGPLRVTGPGQGEWTVRSLQIRDFPVPADAVRPLIARAFGDSGRRTVPVRIPDGVRQVRVRPGGATLYGAARR